MMRCRARWLLPVLLAALIPSGRAQTSASALDGDHDGLSDALEDAVLAQFSPHFEVGLNDCSDVPAQFRSNTFKPTVQEENGTIYGQVFPAANSPVDKPLIEVHFYHLWKADCGAHGHPLDTEHVAVLLQASEANVATAHWKALYWYAAAHEDTVCNVSQIARASAVDAESHGAHIWISPGKHASYLDAALCAKGCGADRCVAMTLLHPHSIINLGEPAHPLNGSVFIASAAWRLEAKMRHSDFPADSLARLESLPEDDIAFASPGRHPAQGIIATSYATESKLALSGAETTSALSSGGDNTASALSLAGEQTGNALAKSFRNTRRRLGISLRNVGRAVGLTHSNSTTAPPRAPSASQTNPGTGS